MTAPLVRATFFTHLRATGPCGPHLPQVEVDGLTALLDAWERLGWPTDPRHVAYTLATAWHECRLDLSIREDGRGRGHAYGMPVNGRVYYGRGASQVTWIDNYRTFGRLLGLDLVDDPDLALVPATSAAILILGARDGLFRPGHTLGRYFNARSDDPEGARAIINGDGTKNGARIAGYHRAFLACLEAARPAAAPRLQPAAWWPRLRNTIRHNMQKGV
ncbi:Chitinase class I [Methylobacterium phyllostachyos]|uniref:Chitinase class I n=1 Tax=Methylobacterium phyllostachyos TaxID=582672 RepID=A0A1H0CGU8_9HYPH|nr:glycoside hydrolase family 19 protein [Methylobacterium phyllostachyos]SDN57053.1 Chitinase class I [Methylobacterium phyllostachyos]